MLTSALAGCAGTDTSDLEQQIADLQQSNEEMNKTITQLTIFVESDCEYVKKLTSLNNNSFIPNDAEWVTMMGVEIYNCNLSGLNNNNLLIYSSSFIINDFSNSNLSESRFLNSNFYGTDFKNANLSYSNFENSGLINVDFTDSNLTNSKMKNSLLIDVNLTGADLTGANLWFADLTGISWSNTTCPDGTNSDDNGDTCENNL